MCMAPRRYRSEHLTHRTLQHAGADPALCGDAGAHNQRHYLAVNGEHTAVYPGVVEGLERMASRGLRLVCLTNRPTAFADPLLRSKRLSGYFDVVFGGDAFEREKPDPLPLLKTCDALGSLPAHTRWCREIRATTRAPREPPVAL